MACCDKETILRDPCQALADGVLNSGNYITHGFTPWAYALLIAQCGTGSSIEEIASDLGSVVLLLQDIDDNTDGIETQLGSVISELQASNISLGDAVSELQSILSSVQAIDGNTDTLESQLSSAIALLTSIDNDSAPDVHGTHTVATGTQAAAPAAGPYYSWVVVKTNDAGTVEVDGITLNATGDSTSEEAQPGFTVPTPTITVGGGGEYEWRTKA